ADSDRGVGPVAYHGQGGGAVGAQHVHDINGVAGPGVERGGGRAGGVGVLDGEGVGAAAQGDGHGTRLDPPVGDVRHSQVADDVHAHAGQALPGRQSVASVTGVVDVQRFSSTKATLKRLHPLTLLDAVPIFADSDRGVGPVAYHGQGGGAVGAQHVHDINGV